MGSREMVIAALIITLISFFGFLIWNAVRSIHYNNSAEWKMVVAKARAASSWVLLAAVACWGVITGFIGKNQTYTISNVGTFIQIIFGIQCLVALVAGVYYERKLLG